MLTRMRPLGLCGVLALFASSCFPPAHSLVGRACDDADPCPTPLYCVDGACSQTRAPDVTLLTADFETGFSGWEASSSSRLSRVTTQHHGGAASLRVGASDGPATLGTHTSTAAVAVASGRHCATAWVLHGAAAAASVTLQVRALGGVNNATVVAQSDLAQPSASAAVPATGRVFQLLKAELQVDAAEATAVVLAVECGSSAPADIFVDDVSLVRTAGACP